MGFLTYVRIGIAVLILIEALVIYIQKKSKDNIKRDILDLERTIVEKEKEIALLEYQKKKLEDNIAKLVSSATNLKKIEDSNDEIKKVIEDENVSEDQKDKAISDDLSKYINSRKL